MVPSLSSTSQVFASPVSDMGNIISRTAFFVFEHITYTEKFMNVYGDCLTGSRSDNAIMGSSSSGREIQEGLESVGNG
ncbi:hypothetical protein Tco_0722756 [Tanacetum coccineum]